MGKSVRIRTALIFTIMVALGHTETLYGYEDNITHPTLTEIAVRQSRLAGDPSLLSSLGLEPFGGNVFADNNNGIPSLNISELIKFGSVDEDTNFKFIRHFFDPQNNRGLTNFNLVFQASPDWILNDRSNIPTVSEYNYRVARSAYFDALTRPLPGQRNKAFAKTFKSLGHVLHHIQDMGQPQHTRNDIHCNNTACRNFRDEAGITLYRPSFYEAHTAAPKQQQGILSGAIPTTGYPLKAPVFRQPRDYWVNTNFPGTGMAEFISENFLTENNLLFYNPVRGTFQTNATEYPLPNSLDWQVVSEPCLYSGTLGQLTSTACEFVQGIVVDPLTGSKKVYIVAKKSWAYHWIVKSMGRLGVADSFIPFLFVVDPIVFDTMYPIVLPRVTAFGAGMIDYFFRGSIDLSFNQDRSQWQVVNTGSDVLNGRFFLFYDDPAGVRIPVATDGWSGGRLLALAPGARSAMIPITRPANSSGNYSLVFAGQMGAEGQAGSNDLTAVVGKKKFAPGQIVTCGETISASGSEKGVLIPNIEMGTTAGNVQLEFQAYFIPDAITLKADNSARTLLATSNGFTQGYHRYEFNYNPTSLGTTTVTLEVDGNDDPGTAWTTTLGCPGQTLDNDDREFQIVPVEFSFGESGGFGFPAGTCSFSFYIDGQFMRSVYTGASGVRFTLQLSAGHHSYDYVNKSCNGRGGTLSGGGFSSHYSDSSGTHNLKNAFYGGAGTFPLIVAQP